jgi:hypothetical protein
MFKNKNADGTLNLCGNKLQNYAKKGAYRNVP